MSNPYTGAVEASLRKSQLLLEVFSGKPSLLAEGLQEAVVVQLWRAYQAFLAEQAYQLQLIGEPMTARELHQQASAQGALSTEVVELFDLQEAHNSWLAAMSAAWERLWDFSRPVAPPQNNSKLLPAEYIPQREVTVQAESVLTWRRLDYWRQALTELTRRQRAQAQEW